MKELSMNDLAATSGGVRIYVGVGANSVAEWFFYNMPESWHSAFGEQLYQACWDENIGNWY